MAKEKYEKGSRMFDPYVEKMDQIFLDDINAAIDGLHAAFFPGGLFLVPPSNQNA